MEAKLLIMLVLSVAASLVRDVPSHIDGMKVQGEQEIQSTELLSGEEKDKNTNNDWNAYFYEADETVHTYEGYFYVTDEIIYYYIDYPTGEVGYTDENTSRIVEWIKSDEANFLEHSTIVCCEEGTEDITDEIGYHAYVEVEGDKRIFRYYNDYFYGSKCYMLMVWEKGKGIVYYMHGNGGMNMHVEFGHNIKEEQKVDYGYPYKLFHQ